MPAFLGLELPANVAPFAFTSASLPPDTFSVVAFEGTEALSRPFAFTVDLVSPDPALDPAAIVGQPAALVRMRGLAPVPVHGLVTHLEQRGRAPDGRGGHAVAYRVRLEPRLSRLGRTRGSRVFQAMTTEEIARDVLGRHGLAGPDLRFELEAAYPVREYTVQYNESDLAFVSRLLEHEGASYWFEHGAGRDVLVVADHGGAHGSLAPEGVLYREGSGLVRDRVEAIQSLTVHDRIVTASSELRDYNYRTPETDLTAPGGTSAEPAAAEGEHYGYGDHYKDVDDGERLARVRREGLAARARRLSGASDCAGLGAGLVFRLEGHYRPGLDGRYLVTAVEHRGRAGDAIGAHAAGSGDGASGEGWTYGNRFEAQPASVPYRPPLRTPVPKLPGLLTAKVESAGGPYAHLDEEGRYRVRMPFDRSDAPVAEATRPIRMAQPYSGPGYGHHFPNHAGTEVVFACVNGDVDRPLALGTVPNPSQGSPVVGANRMENVIRTWGGNALVMDDTQKAEHVRLEATKDHTEQIGDTQTVQVGTSQTITVGTDRSKTVQGSQSESVGGDKSIQVQGHHQEQVARTQTVFVGQSAAETIAIAKALSIGAAYQVSVGAAMNETVAASKSEEVGLAHTVIVGKASTERIGTTKTIEAGERIELVCGQGKIVIEKSGRIEISGTALDLLASGPIVINGKTVDIN